MPKIYLSPAAHGADNPCSYRADCGENIHCNLYIDELEPYLTAAGFQLKRNPRDRTGDRLHEAIEESNAWGADLHYVAHTNAGGGSYSKLMVYDKGTAYGYAGQIAAARRAYFAAEGKDWSVKIAVEPQWAELSQTAAPAVYDELVFHDNAEQIAWFHGHLRGLAAAAAKGICAVFGADFVDPYQSKGEVAIMGKMVNAEELKAWIDAHAVEATAEGGAASSGGAGSGSSGSGSGSAAPALRVGAKVQYSGRLYATSAGGGAGATVSGTYTVSRVLEGKSHGVLLDGGLGWVRAEDCVVVG